MEATMTKSKKAGKAEPVKESINESVKEIVTDIISEVKTEEPVKAEESKPVEKLNLRSEMKKLIESGKYSQRELLDLLSKQFPTLLKSTISTILSDSKSVKYNKFPKLAVIKDGKYQFSE